MADEKKESEKKETSGKKYDGGAIPKATKAASEALKEAESEQ